MNVTEILMRQGGFRLDLTDETPLSVLDQIRASLGWAYDTTAWGATDGHIVVTKQWMPLGTVSVDAALYTGRLMSMSGTGRTLEGEGLSSWLGSGGVPSAIHRSNDVIAAQNLSAWIDEFTGVVDNSGGLTKGTVSLASGATWAGVWSWTSPIEMLDQACAALDAEWRINPDGSIDAGDTVFNTTPTVIVTAEGTGSTLGVVRSMSGRVSGMTIDAGQVTKTTVVIGSGQGTNTVEQSVGAAGTVAYRFDGSVGSALRRVVSSPEADATNAAVLATSLQALYETPFIGFAFDVDDPRARDHMEPGDQVWVADDQAGIRDLSVTPVIVNGRSVYPVKAKIDRMEWQPSRGRHGVYLRRHAGTETWLDLTPYVKFADTPRTSLSLVTKSGRAKSVVQRRFDYGPYVPYRANGLPFDYGPKSSSLTTEAGARLFDAGLTDYTGSPQFGSSSTNVTTDYARWKYVDDDRIYFELHFTLTGTPTTGSFTFALPANPIVSTGGVAHIGSAALQDSGTGYRVCKAVSLSNVGRVDVSGGASTAYMTEASPWTFAVNDTGLITGVYRVA